MDCLSIRKIIQGDKPHLDIASSLNNIGLIYSDQGNLEQALEFYNQSLEIKKTIQGDKPHKNIAVTLNNIGVIYKKQGNLEKAIEFYNQSL